MLMTLFIHIILAVGSLVAAGASHISPSVAKLRTTYALTAGMLLSGTYLVIQSSSHLLEACVMGLSLLAVISLEVTLARNKLERQAIAVSTKASD